MTRTTPTLSLLLVLGLGLGACGDGNKDTGEADPMIAEPSGPADSLTVTTADSDGDSMQATIALGTGLAEVLAVDEVETLLDDDVLTISADPTAPPAPLGCADASRDGTNALVLDFAACENASGTARVERLESRLWVVTFNEGFTLDDMALTGSLTLDGQDASRGEIQLEMYTSDEQAQPDTFAVDTLGEMESHSLISLSGGVLLDSDTRTMELWGLGEVDTTTAQGDATGTLDVGTDGSGNPQDPLTWTLGADCLCPTAGSAELQATWQLTTLVVDLDDFFDVDDGEDDFEPIEMELGSPVDVSVSIRVTFNETCGDFEIEVDVDTLDSVVIALDEVLDKVEAALTETGMGSNQIALVLAAIERAFPDGLEVEIGDTLQQAVEEAVDNQLDGGVCAVD